MEWKAIKDYKGLYEVSNTGLVRSLDREVEESRWGAKKKIKGIILKQHPDTGGYLQVSLVKDGYGTSKKVHTLVWDAFGDKPRNNRILQVDHIDVIKTNNNINNLRLLTNQQNASRRIGKGYYYEKSISKYRAVIGINRKTIHLGSFHTAIEARESYLKAKKELSLNLIKERIL